MAGVRLDGESDEDYIARAARISGKLTMVECLKKMIAMRDGSPQAQRDTGRWGTPCSSRVLLPNTVDEIEPERSKKRKPHAKPPKNSSPTLYRCRGCDRRDVRMLRCSRCKKVYYCNAGCQRAHWPTHKGGCK